jgi:hypothetical protein
LGLSPTRGIIDAMAVPWSALIAATLGTVAAVRAFYRPNRSLTKDGYVRLCAADNACDPAMTVDAAGGNVMSPMAAQVISAGPGWAVLKPDLDDVLLSYAWDPSSGPSAQVMAQGQHVHAGQVLAIGGVFRFSVRQLSRGSSGTTVGAPLEPAAWLAVRGLRISSKSKEPSLWCEGGRALTVPQGVAKCGIELPAPSPYSLLPVTVSLR